MNNSLILNVKCADFIKDNPRLYAHKARRKKIAMIRIEAVNPGSGEVRLLLGSSKLIAGGKSFDIEAPTTLIRKLSEFTWDMAVFLIFDFHPLLSLIDFFILITGPLYNWRLRKKLRSLSDGELILGSGKSQSALIGFRGVPKGAQELQLVYLDADGTKRELQCDVG